MHVNKFAVVGLIVAAGAAVSAAFVLRSRPVNIEIAMNGNGLQSVRADQVELLLQGAFSLDDVMLRSPSGAVRAGSREASREADLAHQTMIHSYPWGSVAIHYAAAGNRLNLQIETKNTSATDSIESVRLTPLSLRFPKPAAEYDGVTPLLAHNIDQIGVVLASYGNYVVAVGIDDIDKPLMVGFPWALNRPANTDFPLSVHTGRVASYPDSLPTVVRPIAPGETDVFNVSLRFGHKGDTTANLAKDLNEKFATAFPMELNWPDHRPIGAIFLATPPQQWDNNPRGWFGDASFLATTSHEALHRRLLATADASIQIMREMNAQGAVTWDIEGQQFFQQWGYVGDPRAADVLSPELTSSLDEYFKRFADAGLLAGISVRPQRLEISADRKSIKQVPVADPTQLLIDKIQYAKDRWGVRLIQLNANTNPSDSTPMNGSVLQKILQRFPDILIIPEHSNLRYSAYSAPYQELRQGHRATSEQIHSVYPKAFSLIYTADGPLDLYADDLKKSVQRGDILMYRTWFPDSQNPKVKALYGN